MRSDLENDGAGEGLLQARHSRRAFLRGVGVAAGAAATLPALAMAGDEPAVAASAPAGTAGLLEHGRGEREFSFTLNGKTQAVTAEPRESLLDVLRDRLGLTGSKEVCARGSCGACSVLLDGVAVNACMLLAVDAEGRTVETIEGISANPAHAGLIDAFCTHDAAQCGFCIPGFVVRSAALLGENPHPTRDEIQAGLSGNLCRCGTYSKIFEAVEAASVGAAK